MSSQSHRGPRRKKSTIRITLPPKNHSSSPEESDSGAKASHRSGSQDSALLWETESDSESDSWSVDRGEDDGLSVGLSDEDFDPSTATDEEYSNVSYMPSAAPPAPSPPALREHVELDRRASGRQYFHRGHRPYFHPRQHPSEVSRRPFREFQEPFRADDPSSSLSAVVSLRGLSTRSRAPGAHLPAAQTWEGTKSTLPTGARTECLTIREVNHYADEAGDSLITLVCYNTSTTTDKQESVQMRWMHLNQDPNIGDFEDVIDSCPYTDPAVKTVALALLRDRRNSTNNQPFQGEPARGDFITRYDHRDHRGQWSTESVVFISVPFFTKRTRAWLNRGDMTPTSATPVRYHVHPDHGFAARHDMATGGAIMSSSDTTSEICVSYLWCLLLGPDIIVTCGDIELKDLLGPSMTVEMKSAGNRRPCAIRITDSDSRFFHLVIDPPLSYFDFLQCVVNKVRLFADGGRVKGFKLFTEDNNELTPEAWLALMQLEELDTLRLLLHRREGITYSSESDVSSDEQSDVIFRGKRGIITRRPRGEVHIASHGMQSSYASRARPGLAQSQSLIINDVESMSRTGSRALQVTIESDDSGGESTRPASERTSPKLKSPATPISGSKSNQLPQNRAATRREKKVEFADGTNLPSQSTSTSRTASANGAFDDTSPLTIYPFFTWAVVRERDGSASLPSHIQIYRLLNRVDKAMARKRPTAHRYVYQRGFECGLSELRYRHPYLAGLFGSVDGAAGTQDNAKTTNMSADDNPGQSANVRVHVPNLPAGEAPASLVGEDVLERYLRPLVTLSLSIGKGFVPAELEVVHRCWKKLWGAIDRILRCVEMHDKQSYTDGTYRVSESLYTASPYYGSLADNTDGAFTLECQACREGAQYQGLKQVLDHLHERHTQCQGCGRPARLSDDPCTVWVEGAMGTHDRTVRYSMGQVLRKLSVFILYLKHVESCMTELQRSVQHVDIPGSRKQSERKLPLLPSTLVRGFEELLLSYITLAHVLSRTTAGFETAQAPAAKKLPKTKEAKFGLSDARDGHSSRTYGSSHVTSNQATDAASQGSNFDIPQIHRQSMTQAKLRFKHARRDLILLSTTTSQAGSVSLTAVGAEYILGVVLAGLNTHIDGKKADVLGIYSRQLARVANQAARRPQRRHFMELHELETNVLAVRRVFHLHAQMLDNYARILDPLSHRVTTKARQALYEVEAKLLEDETKRLESRARFVGGLLNHLDSFKHRTKQQIEVLEEGHGKAIRVFTFVTAFFLPLSFVTSFLGMNTTDIRDTDLDQRIFWKVAIPTTVLILTLAFLYGYKWDSIHDSLGDMWEAAWQKRAQRRARRRAEQDGDGGGVSRWSLPRSRLGRKGESDARPVEKDAHVLNGLPV